jgi:regulator of PEP synthase PpsR (kinase-PPPase family)
MRRTIFFVSDGTGITAETLGHTLLTQFEHVDYQQRTLPFVDSLAKAQATVEFINETGRNDGVRPIVFSTLVDSECQRVVGSSQAQVLDFFGTFIEPLESELQRGSTHASGRSHGIVDRASYYFRIDAVNFALQHDDGASLQHYDEADVILVGVSRSGKTPTCLYLAMQFGVRAANYPLLVEDEDASRLPKSLEPYRRRLFGLTSDAERLQQIRSERRPDSKYASMAQCRKEIHDAEALFRRETLLYLNSATMSVEEIASKILQKRGMERHLF